MRTSIVRIAHDQISTLWSVYPLMLNFVIGLKMMTTRTRVHFQQQSTITAFPLYVHHLLGAWSSYVQALFLSRK